MQTGVYRHYKGNYYQVLGQATHSESGEAVVVYRCLYGDHSVWVRPLKMFGETIMVDGELMSRFSLVQAQPAWVLRNYGESGNGT